MVAHNVLVQGANLDGSVQTRPVLIQMNDTDFPARFLTDLSSPGQPQVSSAKPIATSAAKAARLFQPVQRVFHVALLQLACDTLGQPRLDPTRVDSAGIVIRQIPRFGNGDGNAYSDAADDLGAIPYAWMGSPNGQFRWMKLNAAQERDDPDPTRRPQLQSGRQDLDKLLAQQALANAWTEGFTPAFVAAPAVCEAAGRTLVYALVPTASSEVSDIAPSAPQYDKQSLAASLPTLLQSGAHNAPQASQSVDYHYMIDDYARNAGATDFLTFSLTLRMLNNVFNAFDNTPEAQAIIAELNKHFVWLLPNPMVPPIPFPMGAFYQQAANVLLDYDPHSGLPVPTVLMPQIWDSFTEQDQSNLLDKLIAALQTRIGNVQAAQGRFQDATRLYKLRVFLRIKPENPACPPQLVWSNYSDPFRIAAWYESGDRTHPPILLPDPTDKNFLKNAKPNAFFAVPPGLMNAMQGTSMSSLMKGSNGNGSGGGLTLGWICGFNIPLITICAFFVLNIFLSLLNIVFFWLAFIKICIPFPMPKQPSGSS